MALTSDEEAVVRQMIAIFKTKAPGLPDDVALMCPDAFQEWAANVNYAQGEMLRHGGELYRVAQAHTSQVQHEPGTGTESLYTRVSVGEGGTEVWRQPQGAHDAYPKGKVVLDPEDGKRYRSKVEANVWGPPRSTPDFWEPVAE